MTVRNGGTPFETPISKALDLLIGQSTQMALLHKVAAEHITQMTCLTLAQLLEVQRQARQAMIRQVLPDTKTGPEAEN